MRYYQKSERALTIWDVKECAATELRGFDLSWLPPGLPPQIRPFRKLNGVGIEVDTLVGSVPLRNGDTLQLRPKVSTANFVRMLVEADVGDDSLIRSSEELVAYAADDEQSLSLLAVRPFVNALLAIAVGSLQFGWQTKRFTGAVAAGGIRTLPTMFRSLTGVVDTFIFDRKVRHLDTPENIILATAAAIASAKYQRLLNPSDRQLLARFRNRVQDAPRNSE